MDIIKASISDDRLLERAYMDCIEQFSRFLICGRSRRESIMLLENWRGLFERNERMRRDFHERHRHRIFRS